MNNIEKKIDLELEDKVYSEEGTFQRSKPHEVGLVVVTIVFFVILPILAEVL